MDGLKYKSLPELQEGVVYIDIFGKFVIPTFMAKKRYDTGIENLEALVDFNSVTGMCFKRWGAIPISDVPDLVIYDTETHKFTSYKVPAGTDVYTFRDGQPYQMMPNIKDLLDDFRYEHESLAIVCDRIEWFKLMVTEKKARAYTPWISDWAFTVDDPRDKELEEHVVMV
jgi:hypothetical protein